MLLVTETKNKEILQRGTNPPTILNPRPVTVHKQTSARYYDVISHCRSQEGGIEGCEMDCGLDLPVDHETHAEKVGTGQLTTRPLLAWKL